jgi:hypothetical protein
LPAFYNAEVAAVFSAAICFLSLSLSLSLCAPTAASKALLPQQQQRPLFVLSRSFVASRIFAALLLREKKNGDSEIRSALYIAFIAYSCLCFHFTRNLSQFLSSAICFKFEAAVSGFRPTVAF